jgi:hypothetical protein
MNRHLVGLALLALLIVAVAPAGPVVQAQEPQSEKALELLYKVQLAARREVNAGEPMNPDLILKVYGDNDAGVTKAQIFETYEREYANEKALIAEREAKRAWLGNLLWKIGGTLVGLLALGFIIWAIYRGSQSMRVPGRQQPAVVLAPLPLRTMEPRASRTVVRTAAPRQRTLLQKLKGNPLFRGRNIRSCRRRLIEQFATIPLPFDLGRPVKMLELYVPPKLWDIATGEEMEPLSAITSHRRILLQGPAGMGKTLLLRHLALRAAEGHSLQIPEPLVPVLLEASRLAPLRGRGTEDGGLSSSPLEEALADQLERDGLAGADRVVALQGKQGKLLLLLDSLEEVAADIRGGILQQVTAFLEKCPGCRAVIALRSGASREGLAQGVDAVFEVKEFNDYQLRRYLDFWRQALPADRPFSPEPLLRGLREREAFLQSVRTPLHLALATYLFTEDSQAVPPTRAALYSYCLDAILGKSHEEINRYPRQVKREVLPVLALAFQNNAGPHTGAGRWLDQATLVSETQRALGSEGNGRWGIDAADLVHELAESDGLLVPVHGGFEFRHRTWQEFLAAVALADEPTGLLDRYHRSPDLWLEIVKFWCGLEHESSPVLEALNADDPLTGFVCLAEARQVNAELNGQILTAARAQFAEAEMGDGLTRAFAAVAVHPTQRGEVVFSFLTETLAGGKPMAQRVVAARALAITKLPRAAKELAKVYTEAPEFRHAFRRMDDVAVPELAGLARSGSVEALDDLKAIGTPSSAAVLVAFLWEDKGDQATRAAWRLAGLMQDPQIEMALEGCGLPTPRPQPGPLDWIWEPFTTTERSILPLIVGRVASLLERAPQETAPAAPSRLDARLVLPLLAIVKKQEAWRLTEEMPKGLRSGIWRALRKTAARRAVPRFRWFRRDPRREPVPARVREGRAQFKALLLHMAQPSKSWQFLLETLRADYQFDFLYGLFRGPNAKRRDWLEMARTRRPALWIPPGLARAAHALAALRGPSGASQDGTSGPTSRAQTGSGANRTKPGFTRVGARAPAQ